MGKKKQQQPQAQADDEEPAPMQVDGGSKSAAGSGKQQKALPDHLELQRTRVVVGPEMNSHVRRRPERPKCSPPAQGCLRS